MKIKIQLLIVLHFLPSVSIMGQPVAGYKLVWFDEFESNTLDLSKWAFRTDNKHRSIQLKENISFENGKLILNLRQLKEPVGGKLASGAGIVSQRRFNYW